MKFRLILLAVLFSGGILSAQEPPIPIVPRQYICYQTPVAVKIDGLINEPEWEKAAWTEWFEDIEGSLKPKPAYKTRAKMMWDDQYLYVAAYLEEPHVWATLKERESVIFYDPDFEVFIDPDGDTHHYIEYEMNAFNTQWDLLLLKPYRDDIINNVAIDHWNFNGVRSAVHVDGTINDASDTDKGWSLEIAFPLDALAELSATGKAPVTGEQYRIGFSRVEWAIDIINGKYSKKTHLVNGIQKPLPEDNWVWSPQGVIAMHQPETWAYLQFSEKAVGIGSDLFVENPDNAVKWALRLLYYREKEWKSKHGTYTTELKSLGLDDYMIDGRKFIPSIQLTSTLYEATFLSDDQKRLWHITQDGRIWFTSRP